MKVKLISVTPDARELLIFSKKTRLNMDFEGFQKIFDMSEEEKKREIDYVFGTIGSSWEFVNYVFLIEGVSRAFTQQLERHRVGTSFAEQSQRVTDLRDFSYAKPDSLSDDPGKEFKYDLTMSSLKDSYKNMVDDFKFSFQEARGVLPMNIHSNLLFSVNLRALSSMFNTRLCVRAQGEFQNVAKEMKRVVLEIHPWTEPVLRPNCSQYGFCPFQNYKDCPVKKEGYLKESNRDSIQSLLEDNPFEAIPKGERN